MGNYWVARVANLRQHYVNHCLFSCKLKISESITVTNCDVPSNGLLFAPDISLFIA